MQCDDNLTYRHMVIGVGLNTNTTRPLRTMDMNETSMTASVSAVQLESDHSHQSRLANVLACKTPDEAKRVALSFLEESQSKTHRFTVAIIYSNGWARKDPPVTLTACVGARAENGTDYHWLVTEIRKTGVGLALYTDHSFRSVSNINMAVGEARGSMLCASEEDACSLAKKLQQVEGNFNYVVSKIKACTERSSGTPTLDSQTVGTIPGDNMSFYGWFVVKLASNSGCGLPDSICSARATSSDSNVKSVRLASEHGATRQNDVHVMQGLDKARALAARWALANADGEIGYVYGTIAWVQTRDVVVPDVPYAALCAGVPVAGGDSGQYLVQAMNTGPGSSVCAAQAVCGGQVFNGYMTPREMAMPVLAKSAQDAQDQALRLKRVLPSGVAVIVCKVDGHYAGAASGGEGCKRRKTELVRV